jgi:hypothetical protein
MRVRLVAILAALGLMAALVPAVSAAPIRATTTTGTITIYDWTSQGSPDGVSPCDFQIQETASAQLLNGMPIKILSITYGWRIVLGDEVVAGPVYLAGNASDSDFNTAITSLLTQAATPCNLNLADYGLTT